VHLTMRPKRIDRTEPLRLGVDAETHDIVAVDLTRNDVGDIAELPSLLDHIDASVASMTADGAYDGQVGYEALAERPRRRRSLFHHESQPLQVKRRRLSATPISRPLQSTGV
jgi:hypothetical protein